MSNRSSDESAEFDELFALHKGAIKIPKLRVKAAPIRALVDSSFPIEALLDRVLKRAEYLKDAADMMAMPIHRDILRNAMRELVDQTNESIYDVAAGSRKMAASRMAQDPLQRAMHHVLKADEAMDLIGTISRA